jgi:hypothetical protein
MLAATIIGVLLIPAFFVLIEGKKKKAAKKMEFDSVKKIPVEDETKTYIIWVWLACFFYPAVWWANNIRNLRNL